MQTEKPEHRISLQEADLMRGSDEQQGWMFSYISPEKRVPQDHPLRSIRTMVDGRHAGYIQRAECTGRSILPAR
jgi:hypothetical protein